MTIKFARAGWEELNRQWEAGTLSTEECAQQTLDLMDVGPEQLDDFFDEMDIDNSFIDFIRWAGQQGYPITILSDGYDNYIERILTRYEIGIPYYANHLAYEQGWRFECRHQDEVCQRCGVCKRDLMLGLIQPGYVSVYIGDGYSDICPAVYANLVFAKDNLALLCRERGISFHKYYNFKDVQMKTLEIMGK